MPNKKLLEALKLGYEAEKEGLRSYLKFAKETKVVSGKNMFVQLASDEVDHLELIERMISSLSEGTTVEKVEVPKGRLSKFMPDEKDVSLQPVEKGEIGDEEALKIALSHEKKAIDFYKAEAQKDYSKEVKDFFTKLAGVEEKHYQIIEAELDFMHQDGFWFDTMEFSLEK